MHKNNRKSVRYGNYLKNRCLTSKLDYKIIGQTKLPR